MKTEVESQTDPGDRYQYHIHCPYAEADGKIEAVHSDPGPEFSRGFTTYCNDEKIVKLQGEVDRHTASAMCEGLNGILQQRAAAMISHATDGDERLTRLIRGEATMKNHLMTWISLLHHLRGTRMRNHLWKIL